MYKILILSQGSLERSTDHVCQWLSFYNAPYLRLNGEDFFDNLVLSDLPQNKEIGVVWFRRRISKYPYVNYSFRNEHFESESVLNKFLNDEFKALYSYFQLTLDLNKWINNPLNVNSINKLHVLDLAKEYGIKIPFTEVVTTKVVVETIVQKFTQVIVKPISEVIFMTDENNVYYNMLTKIISIKNIKYVPDRFFPSLVQEHIDKKFEIRTFYLFGKTYSMAILSQNSKHTKEDFRNYDEKRPNRTVPYQLPLIIENRIQKLMDKLGFQMGSLDFILTPNGEYVFLEINPEGQYGMVSYPCNYYIEREQAKIFINKLNNRHEK